MKNVMSPEELHIILENKREDIFLDLVNLSKELIERINKEIEKINSTNKFLFFLNHSGSKDDALKIVNYYKDVANNLLKNVLAIQSGNKNVSDVSAHEFIETEFVGSTYVADLARVIDTLLDIYELSQKEIYSIDISNDNYYLFIDYINDSDIIDTIKLDFSGIKRTVNKDNMDLIYKIKEYDETHKSISFELILFVQKQEHIS